MSDAAIAITRPSCGAIEAIELEVSCILATFGRFFWGEQVRSVE